MHFVATNVRLPRETLDELRVKAARERKSLAQLIREAIEHTFGIGATNRPADPARDPFHKLIGAWESGLTDGAVRHDRDIYGVKG